MPAEAPDVNNLGQNKTVGGMEASIAKKAQRSGNKGM